MTAAQVTEAFDQFLVSAGALVRVNDAGMDHGLIRAFQNRTYDVTKAVPTVVLRNDDYGRIERLLADGGEVKLEFTIVNETYPKGKTSYDVVGEIPGTDKADEIVMLGGHLDSWHSATGATDNAIGSTHDAGSGAADSGAGVEAAAHHPRRSVVGRGRGIAGLGGLREAALRHVRRPEAGIREARLLLQHRFRHRPRSRRQHLRTSGSRRASSPRRWSHSRIGQRERRTRPPAAPPAAPTAPISTPPDCRASAYSRTRSNTRASPGTRSSIPTNGSCRRTLSRRRRRSRRWFGP